MSGNKIHKISIDNKKIETFNVNDAGFLNDIAIDNKGIFKIIP